MASSAEPGFYNSLYYPRSYISPYPQRESRPIFSISGQEQPLFKMIYSTKARVKRSDFEANSLTFSASYYKKGKYNYEFTPRSVDAPSFMEYRRNTILERHMNESRARALAKQQKDKRGGLLSINIPIKSKAVESLFGEGGAGLKVSGYHQITLSGRSQWDDRASTATYRQDKFPALNMEQISRFDISGTIGTKISVSVSQDSKTDIPLANRLMIRYRGEEDDIIKIIEAGNTTLSLPNTRFVGYQSRIRGLFGVKTEAQIGGLKLTAIASQEKGSTERTSINAGASASSQTVRDWQYLDGKIFDLGRTAEFFPEDSVDFRDGDIIKEIYVYKYVETNLGAGVGDTAWMFVDPDNPDYRPDEALQSLVEEVSPDEYRVDTEEHWIMFDAPNAGTFNAEIGVYMIVERASGGVDTIGNITSNPDTLKLIKYKTPDSTLVTWNYMWRNVYSLRSRNVELQGLEINVFTGPSNTEGSDENLDHQDGTPYIEILGLDQLDQSGKRVSDGLVDINTPIIEPEHGLLIFPDRRPFYPSQDFDTVSLDPTLRDIYYYPFGSIQAQNVSEYYIEISSRNRSTEISLGKPNIIEGSERITLNGEQLVKGQDYNINYDFGRVTFLTDLATDPNNDLSIDFEYSPFIMAQKKTLFGIRGEYEVSRDLKLGSTFLYKSDKATERKPKVGQETSRMVVWDADASFKIKPGFLTQLANALPFYTTETPSNLAVSTEMAQSFPNPNIDGIAYLDDFEGSRDSYSLGVYRESWYLASKPANLDESHVRTKLVWFNPYLQIPTDEIWDRELAPGEGGTHTLWLVLDPNEVDRRAGGVDSSVTVTEPNKSWGGIMRYLPAGAANQDRAQLLELRLKGNKGVLHIELGDISEDVNGNGKLDTEDKNDNNVLDDGEDVGLDGVANKDEISDNPLADDPHGDNWKYDDPNEYSRINGTEGNMNDPGTLGRPDTEDINRNRIPDTKNNYFSYRIDLAEDILTSPFYVEGSGCDTCWKSFRIPIREEAALDDSVGLPKWTQINYLRLWLDSTNGEVATLAIAAADIISSNWEDTLITADSLIAGLDNPPQFNVAVINTQENGDLYRPPPGVTGDYDYTNQITEPEQSLMLHFEDFKVRDSLTADTGIADRILFDTPNLMGYRKLRMFVHAPPHLASNPPLFFFRIGKNNKNFYEVSRVLDDTYGIEGSGWIDIYIDFNEITGIKEYLVQQRKDDPSINERTEKIGDNTYRVFGNPDITKVKYLAFGVVGTATDSAVTGDIWIDELQLTEVRRDAGMAFRLSASGNVADLFTYNGGFNYQNSYFRKISGSTRGGSKNNLGSGRSTTGYNFGVSFRLDKFLPRSVGASLPVSIRYSRNTSVPRLRFNSDVILPEELRDKESTVSTSKSFSISESFKKKTKNPIFTILLNNLRNNFSYNRTEGRSPAAPMSLSENYRISSKYSYSLRNVPNVRPFFWMKPIPFLSRLHESHFYFLPQSVSFGGDLNRNLRLSTNSAGVLTNNLTRDFRGDLKVSYKVFDNLNGNFSMNTRRDMSDPETVVLSFNPKKLKLGRETNYNQSFGASYGPTLFGFLTHKFTFSTSYRENLNVINDTKNMSASKAYSVNGSLTLAKLFEKKSKKQRRPPRPGQVKESDAQEKPEGSFIARITNPPIALMRLLTGWIDPITYDFKESYRYFYLGLLDRAQLKFRFGLTDDVGARIDPKSRATGRSTSTSKATNYSFGSGTKLLGGLKTGVSFSRTIRQDIIKSVNPQKSVATTFPNFNFSINQLSTFKFLNPIIRKFAPRTKYSRSVDETFNLTTGHKTSEKTTVSQNPFLSFSFQLFKGMRVDVRTSRTMSEQKAFNSATGEVTRTTTNSTQNTSISTKYSFTWPAGFKIPIFGRVRFRSTTSMALDVSMRKNKGEISGASGSKSESSVLMITPSLNYSFSSQIRGGLSGRWQDTNDLRQRRKSHVREIRIWVDIRF